MLNTKVLKGMQTFLPMYIDVELSNRLLLSLHSIIALSVFPSLYILGLERLGFSHKFFGKYDHVGYGSFYNSQIGNLIRSFTQITYDHMRNTQDPFWQWLLKIRCFLRYYPYIT